ncbi:MAG: hypothetical protein EZS28_025957 [Streblomastix strix]|uniref:Rho-GAP domain-containing protein n=1 Tax=Streblomastix strix TaxID=222440 RepID=A0A5J4V6P7_9EUKA|nr:MAG: hypothetical protein EZS28_025957 [Streblomastix strix]
MLCCETFAPQTNFENVFLARIEKAMDSGHISTEGIQSTVQEEISMFATYSLNKLLTTVRFGRILEVDKKKIADINQITRIRRVFDCSLANIMLFLINRLQQTNGLKTEGIFRKCVTIDETENAIALLNLGDYGNQFFRSQTNPHSYAVLLKNWLKRLEEPIIPFLLCERALDTLRPPAQDGTSQKRMSPCELINTELPLANVLTLKCLSRFLKKVYAEENVRTNMMAVQYIALIFTLLFIKSNQWEKKSPFEKSQQKCVIVIFWVLINQCSMTYDTQVFEQFYRHQFESY